jgi:NADH dehydrogenase [ubiquinone] 1 alpha subcomplex assembly factor 5
MRRGPRDSECGTGLSQAVNIFDPLAAQHARSRAFSLHSQGGGEAPDFLLTRVAEDFSDRLSVIRRTFLNGLELGCHHGVLGARLRQDHSLLRLTTADTIAVARPDLTLDFERLPFAAESFDLVVSGLALQTVNDLPGLLAQVRGCLKPDGLLLAAVMGGRTLQELRAALLEAEIDVTGGVSPRVAPAIDVKDLGHLLQRAGFALPVVDSDVGDVTYAHPLALMRELRRMGAVNVLVERRRTFLRRGVLARAIEIYQQRFAAPGGRVRATFEILTATAWAPHASQQKPLAPGSATARLADVLGGQRAG